MKSGRNIGSFLAVDAIVLAVFNVLAFVIPFHRGGGFWTGYGFSVFAILLCAVVGVYAFGREGMRSKFYGLPLAFVAWPYLIVQVIVGLLEMAVPAVPFKYEIVLNVILLAAVLAGLVSVNAASESLERIDEKVKSKVFFIKSLQADVEGFSARTKDPLLQKELKALAEALRFSDPMSSPRLASIEGSIEAKVSALGESVGPDAPSALALCSELQQLIGERNKKCKLLK